MAEGVLSIPCWPCDFPCQFVEHGVGFGVCEVSVFNLATCVHYSCMVSSSEVSADFFEAVFCQVSCEVHAYLPWFCDALTSFFALEVGESDVEVVSDDFYYVRNADMPCREPDLSVQCILGKFERDFFFGSCSDGV